MKLFGVLAATVSAGLIDHPLADQFNQWKLDHGKSYYGGLNAQKFENWIESHDFVLEHNMRYLMNEESFQVEMNSMADMNDEEFAAMNNLRNGEAGPPPSFCTDAPGNKSEANPADVDWRTKGMVTPIKNQGQCGSCWAFSTVGSMEGAHMKKSGTLVSLSEQNLVDCATKEGNHGCKGGLMQFGFTYIHDAGGIDTEASYPYTAKDGTCAFTTKNVGATLDSCFNVKEGDEAELENAVATIGPISVAIDAHLTSFRLYKSGIYHDKMCSSTHLDHGVLAVGYHNAAAEVSSKGDYWIVKNSWGPTWGADGYIWMAKDRKNACGIATAASYPIAAT